MSMLVDLLVIVLSVALVSFAGIVWLRRRWMVVRVAGESMRPTLDDGDVILARRCQGTDVSRDDIVVFQRPELRGHSMHHYFGASAGPRRWLIKRAIALGGDRLPEQMTRVTPALRTVPDRTLVVLGDNAGLDSRVFGPLPCDRVLGVFIRRLSHS
jgi:signal peptidase I